jgi:hypothetical protein
MADERPGGSGPTATGSDRVSGYRDYSGRAKEVRSEVAHARKSMKTNVLRLMGVGPTKTSCREEHDGAGDRNQHPDRVYFGNGRRMFFVMAVIAYITWIGVRQCRQKQNGG